MLRKTRGGASSPVPNGAWQRVGVKEPRGYQWVLGKSENVPGREGKGPDMNNVVPEREISM